MSNDMENFYKILENKNYKLNTTISIIINKINYALKLILNGWIMDESIQQSWSINFYITYQNYLNLIKFKNIKSSVNECHICNKKFNQDNIVFNCKDFYLHYDCLFSYLYYKK